MMKIFLIPLLFPLIAFSQENSRSSTKYAKMVQNPLANIMSFPFQNNTTFGNPPYDKTSNVLNVQPVIPFFNGQLITRTIFPLVTKPKALGQGSTTSLADIVFTAFYTPSKGKFVVGLGPTIEIPTGTVVSSKKWGLGPSVVLFNNHKKWTYGFVWNNLWSIAAADDDGFNKMLVQYFVNYNFGNGLYVSTAPVITADWKAAGGKQWTLPFGLGGGKVIMWGKIPLNFQLHGYYNTLHKVNEGRWSVRAQFNILVPKS